MKRLVVNAGLCGFAAALVIFVAAGLVGGMPAAQQPQNPSPMVEHTRAHPRLAQEIPPGHREALQRGMLFLPAGLKRKPRVPLLVFFHGGTWLPEVAAARHGKTAVVQQVE